MRNKQSPVLRLVVTDRGTKNSKARKAARKAERKANPKLPKAWSESRPKQPTQDQLYDDVMKLVLRKVVGKTRWQVADETGLSMSTIDHHTKRLTKFPRGISMQMYLKAYGYKIKIVPIDEP